MPENNFETQVQHKMEELKLRPGLSVWAAVYAQILQQKSRRKKRLLSFGLLLFLLAVTLVLSDNQVNYSFKKHSPSPGKTLSAIAGVNSLNDRPNNNHKQKSSNDTSINTIHSVSTKSHSSAIQANPTPLATSRNSFIQKNSKDLAGKRPMRQRGGAVAQIAPGTINENDTGNDNTEQISSVPNNIRQPATQPSPDVKIGVAKNNFSKNIKDSVKGKANTAAAITANKEKTKNNKWNFGINFSAGITAVTNRYLGISNNSNYSTSPAANNGGLNTNGGYTPSAITTGFGFAAGLLATRRLTPKSNIVIALDYKFFKTGIAVGNKIVVNNTTIYNAGNTGRYHGSFNFIEVPLAFQTQVAKIKKHALYFEAGISFSKLIQTNALQFDAAQGYYYFDNALFKKVNTGVSAGLYLDVSGVKKAPLLIGPQIFYSLTQVANTGLYAGKHYSFAGISLHKLLHK